MCTNTIYSIDNSLSLLMTREEVLSSFIPLKERIRRDGFKIKPTTMVDDSGNYPPLTVALPPLHICFRPIGFASLSFNRIAFIESYGLTLFAIFFYHYIHEYTRELIVNLNDTHQKKPNTLLILRIPRLFYEQE